MFRIVPPISSHTSPRFWDALAPQHAAIEDNYLDLRSVRRLLPELRAPVLVVGAGQGLIVSELRSQGLSCDGVDFSAEMIRYAESRRGLKLIQADAKALPFAPGTYSTIIYATGVIDFIADENEIGAILKEGKRVVRSSSRIFVAFYRVSEVMEEFVIRVGLLENHLMSHRESLELYLLNPWRMLTWIAARAKVGRIRAAALCLRLWLLSTRQEKAMTLRMQKLFKRNPNARAVIETAGEKQPYRNAAEIRNLFGRLGVPILKLQATSSCYIVEIGDGAQR